MMMVMMAIQSITLLLLFAVSTNCESNHQKVVFVHAHRVFRFAFNPSMFQWENGDYGGVTRFTYSYFPTLRGLPDMPEWIKYKYSQRHSAGFIYGVPPKTDELVELDVVSTNMETFETGLLKLTLNVTTNTGESPLHIVKLKIDNLNIEDIFDAHRIKGLKDLFKDRLWPESELDLHLTMIASSLEVGYRRPVKPTEKDGVVLQLGSQANFSKALLSLDRETFPLRNFPSCPRNFKRTSVERYFRDKGFAIDWCAFRLIQQQEDIESTTSISLPKKGGDLPILDNLPFRPLPKRSLVPRRPVTSEFLASAIPAGVIFLLSAIVLFALLCTKRKGEPEEEWQAFTESLFLVVKDCFTCCNSVEEKERKPINDSTSTLATMDPARARRASSVMKQTETLRRLAQSRDVTPMLQTPAPLTSEPFVPGQPPPPAWMAGNDPYQSPRGSMALLDRASINRSTYEVLPRPPPPPYSSSRMSRQEEEDGTYLV